ncbi:MAG: hypothetical protein R3C14_49895 [Caldilineaceae bacterium]
MQQTELSIYQSYLVRFWRDSPMGTWRASVQSTATAEMRYFATLDAAWAFVAAQLAVEHDKGNLPAADE